MKQLFKVHIVCMAVYITDTFALYLFAFFNPGKMPDVDNQLLNKPFKLLTASAQNDNALEHLLLLALIVYYN